MLRKLILRYLITAIAIGLVTFYLPGIDYGGTPARLVQIVTIFYLANLLLKPMLKMIALPVEIATLSILSLVVNTLIFWAISIYLPEYQIHSFWFDGVYANMLAIAPVEVPALGTSALASLASGFVSTVLYWLTK